MFLFYSLSAANDHLIDQTVGFCFLCAHVVVALGIRLDHFQWLAGVGCQDLIQFLLRLQDVLRDNADLGRLSLRAAGRPVSAQ